MSFGSRLDALIQERVKKEKFSQSELARQLGVSRVAVSQWVTGKTEPNTETIGRIAKILNVPTDELIPGGRPTRPRVDLVALADVIKIMNRHIKLNRLKFSVDEYAELISLCYEEYMDDEPGEKAQDKGLRLLKFVVNRA